MIQKSIYFNSLVTVVIGLFFFSCGYSNRQPEGSITIPLFDSLTIPDIHKNAEDSLFLLTNNGILKYSGSPFSGYVSVLYSNGSIKEISSYSNGQKEGNTIGYSVEGDTTFLRPYHEGSKHGNHFGWYANGQQQFHYIFENGLSVGNHKEWHDNGQLYQDLNYVLGYELGLQRVWRKDGKLRSNYVMRENGRKYGMLGLKRCAKIDSETGNIDRYAGVKEK